MLLYVCATADEVMGAVPPHGQNEEGGIYKHTCRESLLSPREQDTVHIFSQYVLSILVKRTVNHHTNKSRLSVLMEHLLKSLNNLAVLMFHLLGDLSRLTIHTSDRTQSHSV